MPLVDEIPGAFYRFLDSVPGAERIDMLPDPDPGLQKADYFFRNRTVICEIKTLETETNDKIAPILIKAGVPIQEGQFDLTALLKGRPDENELYWKCINAITTGVKSGMDTANRQIRDTKTAFGIQEADGLWIILHPKVRVTNPDVIMARITRRLRKRNEAGGPKYDQITAFVLFSEIHKLKLTDGTMLSPIIPVQNAEVSERFGVSGVIDELIEGWGAWNGRETHLIHASQLR
jgi:hypothetical protein